MMLNIILFIYFLKTDFLNLIFTNWIESYMRKNIKSDNIQYTYIIRVYIKLLIYRKTEKQFNKSKLIDYRSRYTQYFSNICFLCYSLTSVFRNHVHFYLRKNVFENCFFLKSQREKQYLVFTYIYKTNRKSIFLKSIIFY